MKDIKKEMWESFLLKNGFYYDKDNKHFNSDEWTCFTLLPEKGQGHVWVYTSYNLFAISVMNFMLYNDILVDYQQPEYIVIGCFNSISGKEFKPHQNTISACIKGHIGKNDLYQALYYKNVPIRGANIMIMPEYYEEYLKTRYPGEYENPRKAFSHIKDLAEFSQLEFLMQQIRNCRATGISAKLYYESKVAEAISLVVDKAKAADISNKGKRICRQDRENLAAVISYIDQNLADKIQLNSLTGIAHMGTTKLKYTFKEVYKSTISDYIFKKRMNMAEDYLTNTDLNINQISQIIGYKKASHFSVMFRKNTGILPKEYRRQFGKSPLSSCLIKN